MISAKFDELLHREYTCVISTQIKKQNGISPAEPLPLLLVTKHLPEDNTNLTAECMDYVCCV